MNRSTHLILTSLILVIISFTGVMRCSTDALSGGGTEGGNVVRGAFVNDDKSVSSSIKVLLIPSDYNPVTDSTISSIVTSVTARDGSYFFDHISQGSYSIEAIDTISGKRSLLTRITVAEKDTTIPVDTLRNPGVILVFLPANADTSGYVYIPGTTMHTRSRNGAGYIVLSIPSLTRLNAICYASQSETPPIILERNVQVLPGDTTVVADMGWNYKRSIYFNTTANGAGITQTITDFPVVVRLTRSNFDFTQSNYNASDIRFSRMDTIPLQYEIERWDPVAGLAEIWVKLDTIYGNNNTQSFTMYWGNPTVNNNNITAVFDTIKGFHGVWHLNDSTGTIINATSNNLNGTRNGNQVRVGGVIGYGQYFDGSGAFTEVSAIGNPDTSAFTICAWIKHAVINKRQTIISKSRGGLPSSSYGWLVTLDETGALQVFVASDTGTWGDIHTLVVTSNTFITDTTDWHHIAVVINRTGNNNCLVFIDGVNVSNPANGDISSIGSVFNTLPMRIGSDANGDSYWKGSIDECSFSFKSRSTDWIRLSYMNQRKDDRLLVFK